MEIISTDLTDFDKLGINDGSCIRLIGFVLNKYGSNILLPKVYESRVTEEKEVQLFAKQLSDYASEYASERGFKVRTSLNVYGDVLVEKSSFSFHKVVDFKIRELLEEDEDAIICFDGSRNPGSDRSAIYKTAKSYKLRIKMELNENVWSISRKPFTNGRPKSTKRVHGIFETVRTWLDSIDYNTPVEPPETFTQDIADSYLRTMFNKSPWDIVYRKGKVIKCRTLVRQHKNQWQVHLNSNQLIAMDNYDDALINLALMPHGLTLDDAIIVGKKFNNCNL